IRKAYEQNPKATQEWLETTYPAIKEEAKENKGIIYWGDETGVQAYANRPGGYSPRGVTPEARIVANRGIKLNMVSAINNQGKIHYMIYEKSMNVDIFISFMECLIRESEGRKVYFIVDNLKVHHANCLQPWLKAHAKELELHYLPSYSPELNPDEYSEQ
ncbi:MAG: IS630 family transposase, partial [Akkermansia muciniphila]|nr:IS630 family transposase [Akkermansia muciniphila]